MAVEWSSRSAQECCFLATLIKGISSRVVDDETVGILCGYLHHGRYSSEITAL